METSNDRIPRSEWALAKKIASSELAVSRRNANFKSLTKNQQRVAIAKDVIRALNAKEFVASPGVYFELVQEYDDSDDPWGSRTGRYEVNDALQVKCDVCALGAVFASAAKCTGELPRSESSDAMVDRLSPYFSRKQLRTIEAAFEGWDREASTDGNARTERFGRGLGPTARMRKIMENIIRNNGTFIP